MGRALVIPTLMLVVCPAVAHGDTETIVLPVSRANVVLPDGWKVTGVVGESGDVITGPPGDVMVVHADDCAGAWSGLDELEQRVGEPERGDLPAGWAGRIWPATEAFCHERGDDTIVVLSPSGRDGVDPLLDALADAWFSNRYGLRSQLIVLPGTGLAVQLQPHLTVLESDPDLAKQ